MIRKISLKNCLNLFLTVSLWPFKKKNKAGSGTASMSSKHGKNSLLYQEGLVDHIYFALWQTDDIFNHSKPS
jgi:hypothetical protein